MSVVHDHDQDQGPPLHTMDLNLLVAFDVLARELNVTRAAARIGVTQSALSHTLRRLRDLLGDELLVRAGGRMHLTPRAQALVLPVRAGLDTLSRALSQPLTFLPERSTREFRVAGPDLAETLFVPPLLRELHEHAPNVRLTIVRSMGVDPAQLEDLASGDLDLIINARQLGISDEEAPLPAGLMRRSILRDSWSCFLREDHPALGRTKRLTLRRFLRAPHLLVSPTGRGGGIVDLHLKALGEARRVALRVPHFVSAPVTVAQSDLILTAPTSLRFLVEHLNLRCVAPPMALPMHSIDILWHRRFHEDPGHQWLRERLVEVAAPLAAPAPKD